MSTPSCPSCGARLRPSDEQCPLCGHSQEDSLEVDPQRPDPEAVAETGATPTARHCTSCGTAAQPAAKFCHNCGEALAGVSPARLPDRPPATAPEKRESSSAGRQAFLLVGAGAALVILLFVLTQISDPPPPLIPPEEAAAAQATAVPSGLPEETVARLEQLEARIESATDDDERNQARVELIDVLVSFGGFARAGELQEAIASEVNSPDAWADAGSFYLAHMLRTDGPERPIFALRSGEAYERALELRPGDLDIRTDLATAYLNDGVDPMRAVTVIQEVLEDAPDHPRARFNYGLMLLQIGRNDQAIEQFQHVVEISEDEEFVHQRAREELQRLGAAG